MDINISYDASVANAPSWFKTAVTTAVNALDALFTNAISVTVAFGWGEENNNAIPAGAASSSQSSGNYLSYSNFVAALTSHATSADDLASVASLPASDPTHGGNFYVSSAEQKALGLKPATASGTDGYVGVNASLNWATNPGGSVAPGTYDSVGAIEHELTEVLGRVGFLGTEGGPGVYASMDLFRYSAPGQRSLTPGPGFFSVDGQTMLTPFNDPTKGGDAADWASSVQGDSFGSTFAGINGTISTSDLRSMDVIGYTLANGATGTTTTGSGSSSSGGTSSGSTSTGTSTGGGTAASASHTATTFVFKAHPGHRTITNFVATGVDHDILNFGATSLPSIAAILNHTKQVGGDAVITIDAHDSITLKNTSVATLRAHKSDFLV